MSNIRGVKHSRGTARVITDFTESARRVYEGRNKREGNVSFFMPDFCMVICRLYSAISGKLIVRLNFFFRGVFTQPIPTCCVKISQFLEYFFPPV